MKNLISAAVYKQLSISFNKLPMRDIRELKFGTSITIMPVSVTRQNRMPNATYLLSFVQPQNCSNLGFNTFITGNNMTGYVKIRAIARQILIRPAQKLLPPSSGGSKFCVIRSFVSGPNDK